MSRRRRRPGDRLLWEDTTPDVLVERVQVEPQPDGVLVRVLHGRNPADADAWVELWVTPAVLRRLLAAHLASSYWAMREPD